MFVNHQYFAPLFLTRTQWFRAHSVTLLEGLEIFCGLVVIPLVFILTFNKLCVVFKWLAGLRLQELIHRGGFNRVGLITKN